MSEVLAVIPLVQAFARERHEEERFDAVTAYTLREGIRIARLEAAATRSSEVITALGTAAAVLFGALQVLHGMLLPGDLVLVVAYLGNMYRPIKSLAKLSTDFSKAMASAERISEVLDIEPEIQDRTDALEAPPLRGAIAFEGVSFDYGDGKGVLRDVSFDFVPGQGGAIGCAVIRNAPGLVWDEPMTGLDVESEAKVRGALERLMADHTCLMITHDLPSVATADLVLVLEEGRIVERGSHAELVVASSRYRRLYELSREQAAAAVST